MVSGRRHTDTCTTYAIALSALAHKRVDFERSGVFWSLCKSSVSPPLLSALSTPRNRAALAQEASEYMYILVCVRVCVCVFAQTDREGK